MPKFRSWWVYLVRCRDGTLYTGATNDVPARVRAHNAGRGARYTRGRGPVRLVFAARCRSKSHALRREARIKRLSRPQKESLVSRPRNRGRDRSRGRNRSRAPRPKSP